LIYDENDFKVVCATIGFRRLLSLDNPPIQELLDSNVVPRFNELLQRNNFPKIQFEAAWCLTNLASGSIAQV
jgi:importin subunit alpha-1